MKLSHADSRRFQRIHRALFGLANAAVWNRLVDDGDAVYGDDFRYRVTLLAEVWYAELLLEMEGDPA